MCLYYPCHLIDVSSRSPKRISQVQSVNPSIGKPFLFVLAAGVFYLLVMCTAERNSMFVRCADAHAAFACALFKVVCFISRMGEAHAAVDRADIVKMNGRHARTVFVVFGVFTLRAAVPLRWFEISKHPLSLHVPAHNPYVP